jgi:hypothetical protein
MSKNDGKVLDLEVIHGTKADLEHRFNVVIVAEGYQEPELDAFDIDAEMVRDAILAAPPFDALADRICIARLRVSSVESGADEAGLPKRTFFDALFPDIHNPNYLCLADDWPVVEAVRAKLGAAAAHKIIVLVNVPRYGGSGGQGPSVAVAAKETQLDGFSTVLHELGHAFGLADEYDHAPLGQQINVSLTPVKAKLPDPWKKLVDPNTVMPTPDTAPPGTVGAFTIEAESSRFRPQQVCKMDSPEKTFCAVCNEHIKSQLTDPKPPHV